MATSRAGQTVHLIWNETLIEIFADEGEHITSYPRPTMTGLYYGPRTPGGTRIKGAGNNPSAGVTGSAERTVSRGGYVGALANKFYAGYNRQGEQVTIIWDASTVTIIDSDGNSIAHYAKPEHRPARPGHPERAWPRYEPTRRCQDSPPKSASVNR